MDKSDFTPKPAPRIELDSERMVSATEQIGGLLNRHLTLAAGRPLGFVLFIFDPEGEAVSVRHVTNAELTPAAAIVRTVIDSWSKPADPGPVN